MMNVLLRLFGWCFTVLISLGFLVFTVLPLLDTNDSVVFEAGAFGMVLGRFVGLLAVFGFLPLWIAGRREKRAL